MLHSCWYNTRALAGVHRRAAATAVGSYRLYSSKSPSASDSFTEEKTTKDDSRRSVVDTPPVYSEAEAEAEAAKVGTKESAINQPHKKPQAGSRTGFVCEREPVVVHNIAHPLQCGKWYRIVPESYEFTPVGPSHIPRVPKLAHGLERVLFSPGVHCLQDPNSGVYNFNPYVRDITQPADFDYDKLTPYITSSQDIRLMSYAQSRKRRFFGSTSSMTHVLSHLYFLVSAGKQPDISSLSMAFAEMPSRFTRGMRYPASIALRYRDGAYGIDADKSFDVKDSILSILGKSLEKLLTSTPAEFEKYKKENSWKVKDVGEENYHYVEFDEFVLRSQLDCRDDRLPRKTFDLKTRGSLAVRMDLDNYEVSKGYQIKSMKGRLQSFEREYYDMIRSAFLKYNFQTRIGNMDGIFVAYHNTARMFGFQYISRREMDTVLYGNETTGTKAFRAVLILLGKLLRTLTDKYPEQDLRITFDTERTKQLDVWVEVVNDEAEAVAMQSYQDADFMRAIREQRKARQSKPAKKGTDPFANNDPLDPSNAKGADEDLVDEGVDEYADPADDIYVNCEVPILHYTVEAFSTVNNQDTDEPVTVRYKEDEWYINWKLTKSHMAQDRINAQYRRLRLRQATFFERPASDTPEEDLSPMLKILRRISRQNEWRNNPPKGRVVVNRSPLPVVRKTRRKSKVAASSPETMAKPADSKQQEPSLHTTRKTKKTNKIGSTNKNQEKSSNLQAKDKQRPDKAGS
ncbi:hypothetical protein EDC05_003193 [Coemansia umbellata]|uniref:Pet127-domain-containing protein n=1 Tax=Coemansia umbellata TaxID=1424467 RepID=A0ABQ8PLV1_9FUNG|nr:hypothetical protein EDC05_003193 [Coemansia umbellata]